MSDTPKTPVADWSADQIEHHVAHPDTHGDTLHEIAVAHPTGDNFVNIASHPNVHPHTLEHIHNESIDDHFKNTILEHPKAPATLVTPRAQAIDAKEDYSGYSDKDEILHHPNVDPRVRHQKVKEILSSVDEEEDHYDGLGFSRRHTLQRHIGHENISADEVNELAQHPLPSVRRHAVRSEKCGIQHRLNHINESNHSELADFVSGCKNLHPDLIRLAHARSKTMPNSEDPLGDDVEEIHHFIAQHKNTPADILAELESSYGKHDEDGRIAAFYSRPRLKALQNPNFPLEKVKEFALNDKDEAAHTALIARSDTDAETLRLLHSKHKDADMSAGSWDHGSSLVKGILKHPNTPIDVLKGAIEKDTASARAVLGRDHLHEDLLHALVEHKNKNVAIDALGHRSVTPAVVERAFKRKSADVSRAASAHRHATPEMKAEKAVSDPKTAIETLKNDADPVLIQNIYENVKARNPKELRAIHESMSSNPSSPSKVLNDLVDHYTDHDKAGVRQGRGLDEYWETRELRQKLATHPNISPEARKKLVDTGAVYTLGNSNVGPDEVESHLNSFKDQMNSGSISEPSFRTAISLAARHPNLKEGTARKIVSGEYGQIRVVDGLHFNSKGFTPEVIKEGLKAPEEFSDGEVKRSLASSSNLDAKHIEELGAEHLQKVAADGQNSHESRDILRGLLANPNASRDFLNGTIRSMIKDSGNHKYHDRSLETAVQHDNLTAEDIDSLMGDASAGKHDIPDLYREGLAKRSNKLNLSEKHAATTNDEELVSAMIRDGRYGSINEGVLRGAFKNPNAGVIIKAIETAGEYHLSRLAPQVRKDLIDSLNDSNPEAAAAAFSHMTPEGQKVYTEKYGATDPSVIRSMKSETLKDVRIQPHFSRWAVDAVIAHAGVTKEHLEQAIEHGPRSAGTAVGRVLSRFGASPWGKSLVSKAIDKHLSTGSSDDSYYLVNSIALGTSDPELLGKLLDHPQRLGPAISTLLQNTALKSSDFDRLTSLQGPEYEEVTRRLATSKKASVKLLGHIAEHYPEHLQHIASNPRAASAKVLKQIVEKGDDHAHIALIENEKVPEGVKDELLKNVRLLLKTRPETVSSDVLAQHANHEDLNVVSLIAKNRNSTPETLSDVTQRAIKDWKPDAQKARSLGPEESDKHERAYDILKAVAKRRDILPDAQQAIAEADPALAVEMYRNDRYSSSVNRRSPNIALEALKMHQDSPEFGDLHAAILESDGFNDPELIDHLIKTSDLDHIYRGERGSHRLASFLNKESRGDEYIRPEHVESLYNKLKTERGPGYSHYSDDSQQAEADASLLTAIAKKSSNPEHLSEIADTGVAANALLANPNLTPDMFARLASSPSTYTELTAHTAVGIGKSNHMTPEVLDKILNIIHPNSPSMKERTHSIEQLSRSLASRKDLSEKATTDLYKVFGHNEALASPKMPKSIIQEATKKALADGDHDVLGKIIGKRPDARLDNFLSLIEGNDEKSRSKAKKNVFEHFAQNPHAKSEDLLRVYNEQDRKGDFGSDIDADLAKHPSTPEDVIMDMLQRKFISEKDAMSHPVVGGKLWRGKKHEFPKDFVGLKRGNESNEAIYREREEKIKKVMAMIPEGQHIEWAAFKKAYPSLSNDPVVNKMFTSAPKQRLTKAHAEQYRDSLPSKSFHVSYQRWNGIQRHNEGNPDAEPQLVVNINNGEFMDDEFKKDPKLGGLFRMVQNASNFSGHPITPQCVGWSRVDTSHKDHWFIDEIQSDFNSHLSKLIKDVVDNGSTNKLEEYGIEPEESDELVRRMVSHIQGWEKALMNNIIETAKKHGVKKISIQSAKGKSLVNKGKNTEVTHKYKKTYDGMPQDMGFVPGAYEDLPTHNPKSQLVGESIWTMNLDEQAEQAQLGLPLLGPAQKKDPKKIA